MLKSCCRYFVVIDDVWSIEEWKTIRLAGVYDDWEECRRQVHRFSGNSYKVYNTRAEAEDRYARYLAGERRELRRNRMKTTFIVTAFLFYVIVV